MTRLQSEKDAMTLHRSDQLTELAMSLGEPIASAANRPIRLDNPQTAWFVEQGELDVFLVEYRDGEPASSLKHVLRADQGRLVFCVGEWGGQLGTIAKGLPNSRVRHIRLEDLRGNGIDDALADQVDIWLSEFAATVSRQIEVRPRTGLLISPGESLDAEAGCVLSAHPGNVVWVQGEEAAVYMDTEDIEVGKAGPVPLTADTWIAPRSPARVTGISSREMNRDGRLLPALDEFHRLALGAEQLNRLLLLADEVNEQTARASHRRLDEAGARQGLFTVLGSTLAAGEKGDSPLLAALEVVGEHQGIVFRPPPRSDSQAPVGEAPSLQDVLNMSGVRSRKVRLTPEDKWWVGDSGAMLGFLREDGRPVALLPGVMGRYRVVDPASGRSARLNGKLARDLGENAWCFYDPLPENAPVGVIELTRFAVKNMATDWGRFAITGLLASLMSLAPAIMVGMLVNWALPAGADGTLFRAVVVLSALAIVGGLLLTLQGMALMRLEGRAMTRVGAAIWDRLLRLPPGFFRRFTAGELTARMMVFWTLRDQVSGVLASALLGIIFLLPALGLLFLYNAALAWTSLGIGLFALAVTALLGFLQIAPQRRRYAAARGLAGELFQFIGGMSKLRSAGAEGSAFAAWARGYREQILARRQSDDLNKHLVAFSAAVPPLAVGALFAVAFRQEPGSLTAGDFLVIFAVSMVFYTAVVSLGRSFELVAAVIVAYEQLRPMLLTTPDKGPASAAPAELSGEVHFDRVSFRYSEDSPLVLDAVSIEARPGEFVALVGESGSGKTTLLRLALGLEEPTGGAVYYDGRDLANLDRSAVRRQIGVVVQDGALLQGNILDNIVGMNDDLTIDDAWRAARLADADRDIEAMPMGMFTAVNDSVATFSGGQMQRIMVAAALVRNPQVLFLDEATSWLDANSQTRVMQGIESLAATRIVIAHRLSTISKADRIYVLQDGRVAQQGNFDELYETEGIFRELVRRQMT